MFKNIPEDKKVKNMPEDKMVENMTEDKMVELNFNSDSLLDEWQIRCKCYGQNGK
jgi:hypothetical protein